MMGKICHLLFVISHLSLLGGNGRGQAIFGTLIDANRTLIGGWSDWMSVRLEKMSVPSLRRFGDCPPFQKHAERTIIGTKTL
jgi:hypothetical protein